jgi:hypothetical protein
LIETITTSIFSLKLKENHINAMAAHAIRLDFCYRPQPNQIGRTAAERLLLLTC